MGNKLENTARSFGRRASPIYPKFHVIAATPYGIAIIAMIIIINEIKTPFRFPFASSLIVPTFRYLHLGWLGVL
jgi:hypothetical protein